jgi:sulfite exporter TauE/SafE
MSLLLWTALILGLSGSLHCVGMCGPIALALPLSARQRFEVWKQVAIYHSGRIMTYSLMGLLFGLFGQGIFLIGWQKWFAIGLGVLILVGVLFSWSIEHQVIRIPIVARLLEKVKYLLGKNLRMNTSGAILRVGMLNGLLPCGLVYVALFGAVSTGDAALGGLYMMMFGLGTTPLIFALMLMGKQIPVKFKSLLRKLSPVVLVLVALLLIYRGYLLEVPADLDFWEATNFQPMCH